MLYIKEKDLEILLQAEYQKGMEKMQQKILMACEQGSPIDIGGRAYFVKSDIQNLRDIMEDLEKN